jgi:acyl dehydratase
MTAELPELLYEDLPLGKEFPVFEYPITRDLVEKFIHATNDDNPLYTDEELSKKQGLLSALAPTGLAGIFGRLAYLQHHRMPPGGILAKQEMQFLGPFYVGDTLQVRARVTERFTKKERNFVTIESVAKRGENERVTVVRVTAIWPK